MSRARELARMGGSTQVISGVSTFVGIATFASDVDMFSNLSVTGDLNVTGDLSYDETTATNSRITGVSTTKDLVVTQNANVTGIVTAASFEGDGSSLTGIDATSLKDSGGTVRVQASEGGIDVTGVVTSTGADLAGPVTLGDSSSDQITVTGKLFGALIPTNDDLFSIGSSSAKWRDLYIDGTANLDAVSIGLDGGSCSGSFSVSQGLSVNGALTANGNVDLGNETSDTITANGRFDSPLNPSTDSARDIGTTSLRWRNVFVDDVNVGGGLSVGAAATVGGNLTVTGNLTVDGTTTTVNSTTLTVDDKNIELGSVATPSDTTANGGGITLKGASDHTLIWYNDNDHWESSEHFNLVSGKVYQIADSTVLSATTLGAGVTSSSLTSVGTLASLTVSGTITANGSVDLGDATTDTLTITARVDSDIVPSTNNARALGTDSLRWSNIYSNDLDLSNEGSVNDFDGTWGSYLIQEGEEDLFILNRRNGKKYKFVLQEV